MIEQGNCEWGMREISAVFFFVKKLIRFSDMELAVFMLIKIAYKVTAY